MMWICQGALLIASLIALIVLSESDAAPSPGRRAYFDSGRFIEGRGPQCKEARLGRAGIASIRGMVSGVECADASCSFGLLYLLFAVVVVMLAPNPFAEASKK